MGVGKVLLVSAALLALAGYALYTPIPDGYSTSSVIKLQLILGTWRAVDVMARTYSYFSGITSVEAHRRLTSFMVHYTIGKTDPDIKETDAVFAGVPVRMYEPVKRPSTPLSGIVYYHGGGFVFGDLDVVANMVRAMSKQTNSVVVSVDYRLAPEHPFPAGFEDCVAATKHFLNNAKQFGVDATRVAVAGDSAGGNLAAVVSLKLRDDKFTPAIKLQVLLYPVIQGLDFQTPSMIQHQGELLSRRLMASFTALYLEGHDERLDVYLANEHVAPQVKKMSSPYVDVSRLPAKYLSGYQRPSVETGNDRIWQQMKDKLLSVHYCPLVAPDLTGLPKAYVFTAEYDVLRDEGFLYVYRLKDAGVHVEHVHSDIAFHGIMSFAGDISEAAELFADTNKFIANNL